MTSNVSSGQNQVGTEKEAWKKKSLRYGRQLVPRPGRRKCSGLAKNQEEKRGHTGWSPEAFRAARQCWGFRVQSRSAETGLLAALNKTHSPETGHSVEVWRVTKGRTVWLLSSQLGGRGASPGRGCSQLRPGEDGRKQMVQEKAKRWGWQTGKEEEERTEFLDLCLNSWCDCKPSVTIQTPTVNQLVKKSGLC